MSAAAGVRRVEADLLMWRRQRLSHLIQSPHRNIFDIAASFDRLMERATHIAPRVSDHPMHWSIMESSISNYATRFDDDE